jgi:hypothetical protein
MPWNIWGKVKDVAGKVWNKVLKPGINALAPTIDKYVPAFAGAANAFMPGLGSAVEQGWTSLKSSAAGNGRLKPDIDPDRSYEDRSYSDEKPMRLGMRRPRFD